VIESLSGQGINVQQGRPDAPRTLRRIWLAGEIADVHKASGGTYGALRVTAEPDTGGRFTSGTTPSSRSCARSGSGVPTRRLPRGARVSKVTSLDLVGRVFRRDRPNELWVTDITEHPTQEGKIYCWSCWTASAARWFGTTP